MFWFCACTNYLLGLPKLTKQIGSKMEAGVARVQDAVNKMVNDLERKVFRKMQVDMYRCSIRCCENTDMNAQEVETCVQTCSAPVQRANTHLQNEIQNFQDRLQRCAYDCQDDLKDRLSSANTEDQKSKLRKDMDSCLLKCTDKSLQLVPDLEKRLKKAMTSL